MHVLLRTIKKPLEFVLFLTCRKWASRCRGVAKTRNSLLALGEKHSFLCFPCSMRVLILLFATPPQRECDFLKSTPKSTPKATPFISKLCTRVPTGSTFLKPSLAMNGKGVSRKIISQQSSQMLLRQACA